MLWPLKTYVPNWFISHEAIHMLFRQALHHPNRDSQNDGAHNGMKRGAWLALVLGYIFSFNSSLGYKLSASWHFKALLISSTPTAAFKIKNSGCRQEYQHYHVLNITETFTFQNDRDVSLQDRKKYAVFFSCLFVCLFCFTGFFFWLVVFSVAFTGRRRTFQTNNK